jgi:hypothetical protein
LWTRWKKITKKERKEEEINKYITSGIHKYWIVFIFSFLYKQDYLHINFLEDRFACQRSLRTIRLVKPVKSFCTRSDDVLLCMLTEYSTEMVRGTWLRL